LSGITLAAGSGNHLDADPEIVTPSIKLPRTHRPARSHSGFTLVEIAIVLVIIGLLLGGILKGQEMIVQAKIKTTIADFNGVLAAYNGYLDRYHALPGDDAGAGRWSGALVGNGDSVVNGPYQSQVDTDESRRFWQHLRLAGFVPGQGTAQPVNAYNGILGIQTGDALGNATLASSTPTTVPGIGGLLLCSSQIPDKVAIAIDNQTDDGESRTGQVRAVSATGNAAVGTGQAPEPQYQETGVATFVVCRAL
jgi:prepilin-type N-terminal cleavage/methylation domain-containing protein